MLLFTLPTAAVAFNTAFIRARSLSSTLRHPLSSSSLNANAAIPVTLLSGFLGSGKTSTLQYVLESSSHNLTIGVIVNDVAAVNIDSKLVKSTSIQDGNDVGYMEMQNGCACCSLSDELLTTVESLLDQRQQQTNKKPFDHILIELSGVADPTSVRGVFEGGRRDDHAIFSSTRPSRNPLEEWSGDGDSQSEKVKMTISKSPPRIVTLVDSTTFNSDFFTPDSVADRPAWIEAEKAVGQGENVITDADLCLGNGVVAELLVEQVEAADVVVINKLDLLEKLKTEGGSTLSDVEKVVAGLNKKAKVYSTSFGKVDVGAIFEGGHEPAHEHACDDPKCDDPSHNHDHDHDHDHDHGHDCGDPTCTDPTHDHSHDHEHSHSHSHSDSHDCGDPTCTDPTHDHSHDHEHSHSHSDSHDCGDPTCTDPTHNHAPKSTTTASTNTNSVGITSFTYKSDRPFNVGRLLSVLNTWPVPVKDTLDLGELATISREGIEVDGVAPGAGDVFASIIRSKGFCWMCPSLWDPDSGDSWRHDTAMFWSHAGKHFGITSAGKWWGTVVDKQKIKEYLVDMPEEYERVMNEDWTSEEWGDRRQELVFIGVNYDEEAIVATLDKCLLTDGEIDEMRVAVKVREQSILN